VESNETATTLKLKVEQLTTIGKTRNQELEELKEALKSEKNNFQTLQEQLHTERKKKCSCSC